MSMRTTDQAIVRQPCAPGQSCTSTMPCDEHVSRPRSIDRGACIACLVPIGVHNGVVGPHPGPIGSAYESLCIGSGRPPFRSRKEIAL